MTEGAATSSHGAFDCEIEGCDARLTCPVRGTRYGLPESWRLCRLHGVQMVAALHAKGERVTHDGWAPAAPLAPPPRRNPPTFPLPLPTPTPTPTPEASASEEPPVKRTRPTCLVGGCSATHLAHRLCTKHLARARTRGLSLTADVTPEQIEIILVPHSNKGGGSSGRAAKVEAELDPVAASSALLGATAVFWEAEANGFEVRLNAVNAALDAAGIDPSDQLEEGAAVRALAVQLSKLRELVSSIRETLGLLEEHDDAEVFAEVERLVQLQKPPALAKADAFRHRVAEAVIGRAVEDVPYDDAGLLVALQDALFTVAQRQELLLTPEDLRARVAELDAAEEAAEEAEQLEVRAKRSREEAQAHRARALGASSAAA